MLIEQLSGRTNWFPHISWFLLVRNRRELAILLNLGEIRAWSGLEPLSIVTAWKSHCNSAIVPLFTVMAFMFLIGENSSKDNFQIEVNIIKYNDQLNDAIKLMKSIVNINIRQPQITRSMSANIMVNRNWFLKYIKIRYQTIFKIALCYQSSILIITAAYNHIYFPILDCFVERSKWGREWHC